jgi:hypothetical protein
MEKLLKYKKKKELQIRKTQNRINHIQTELKWTRTQLGLVVKLLVLAEHISTEDIEKYGIKFDSKYIVLTNTETNNKYLVSVDPAHSTKYQLSANELTDNEVLEGMDSSEYHFISDPEEAAQKFIELLEKYNTPIK